MKPLPLRITLAVLLLSTLAPKAFADLNMVETGSLLSETWQEPAVFGTTIYVAATTNVTILDVSNPADPVEIRKIPLTGTIDGVLVVGSTLYVARGTVGVSIYDIADPENPALIAGWSFRSHRLHHDAGRVYVAGASAGMAI